MIEKNKKDIFVQFPIAISFLEEVGISKEFLQKKLSFWLNNDRDTLYLCDNCSYATRTATSEKNRTLLDVFYEESNNSTVDFCSCFPCTDKLNEYAELAFNSKDPVVLDALQLYLQQSHDLMVMEKLLATDFTVFNFSLHRFTYVISDILTRSDYRQKRKFFRDPDPWSYGFSIYESKSQTLLKDLRSLAAEVYDFMQSDKYMSILHLEVEKAVKDFSPAPFLQASSINFADFCGKFVIIKLPLDVLPDVAELMEYKDYYNFSTQLGFSFEELFENIDHACTIGQVFSAAPFALWQVPGEFIRFIAAYAYESFSAMTWVVLKEPWSAFQLELAQCFLKTIPDFKQASSVFEDVSALCTAVLSA